MSNFLLLLNVNSIHCYFVLTDRHLKEKEKKIVKHNGLLHFGQFAEVIASLYIALDLLCYSAFCPFFPQVSGNSCHCATWDWVCNGNRASRGQRRPPFWGSKPTVRYHCRRARILTFSFVFWSHKVLFEICFGFNFVPFFVSSFWKYIFSFTFWGKI